jgi:hypothetical protein
MFGKPELDSADRATIDMRFRKRAGAVALLERWAVVAPLDFFEEQISFTDSPRDIAESAEAAHASPDATRRQSQLRHSTNPEDHDQDDDRDHFRAQTDMHIDDSSPSSTNDDESPTSMSDTTATTTTITSTNTTSNSTMQTDEDADDEGLLTSPTKRVQHYGGLRRSIGTMRQLRPQVAAFFRAEHGRFARRVAAIEAQLLSTLEPLSVESREIVEITSVIEDGITTQAPSGAPTVGNLWNPSTRVFDEPSVLAVAPSALAGVLSAIEYTLMARVAESPQQLLRQAWNSQDRATVAPDVLRYIGWFNMASRWVAVELVKPQQQEMRSRVLAHFIHTAAALHALGNYNGLFEIMAALHSAAISRMKATWAALADADRDSFASLTEFCAPARNYRRLRDALAQKDDRARLPYLGVFLTDQTSIDDSVSDWIDMAVDGQSVTLLNFAKARQSAQLLINLRRWLRVPYARVKREQRMLVLECVAAAHSWDDSKVFQLSQLREPGASASAAALSAAAASDENAKVSTDRAELTQSDWQLLRVHSELVRFAPGDVILSSGEPSDVLFVVVSGECALLVDIDGSQSALMSAATSANNSGSPTPERRRSSVSLAPASVDCRTSWRATRRPSRASWRAAQPARCSTSTAS